MHADLRACLPPALACALIASGAGAQAPGSVATAAKISDTVGFFTPRLDTNDQLGRSIARIGDLDLDGVVDIASSGLSDDDGGLDVGAAYVIFLQSDGSVKATQKISLLSGGFTGPLHAGDQMGRAAAGIGDLDADGIPDLALGANFDDDGGRGKGAVWILFLNRDGTVKGQAKISATQGGLTGLDPGDQFGRAIAELGDFNGDAVPDMAVAAPYDDDGGLNKGAIYLLFLDSSGSVRGQRKISQTQGSAVLGATPRLRANDLMGYAVCNLGDFDGNGAVDLVAGAVLDDDGALNAGAIWILFLDSAGRVLRSSKVSALAGGFTGVLESPDQFGDAVAAIGDLNADGLTEIAVGAVKDSDGGKERGAVWILFPNPDGSVAFHQKISDTEGNFLPRLDNIDWLGSALAPLGDFDGNGVPDLAIGARNDDDGGSNHGALYVTWLNGIPAPAPLALAGGPGNHHPSLGLLAGSPAPGASLVLHLGAPASASDAEPALLISRRPWPASGPGPHGLALDPRQAFPSSPRVARLDGTGAELVLEIPADPALSGEVLHLQGLWVDVQGRTRELSEPLKLRL